MKGVIWKIEGRKSIVFFQNGDFRAIRTPPDAESGMAVTVSYNKKLIGILAAALSAVLITVVSVLLLYFAPTGYIDIIYGRPEEQRIIVELVVNRHDKILEARIFTNETAFAASLPPLEYNDIDEGYSNTIMAASLYPVAPELSVWITHKNIHQAEEIRERLSRLTRMLEARTGRKLKLSFEIEPFI